MPLPRYPCTSLWWPLAITVPWMVVDVLLWAGIDETRAVVLPTVQWDVPHFVHLYDLANDPFETVNLAYLPEYHDKVEAMAARARYDGRGCAHPWPITRRAVCAVHPCRL